jgi:hypothetical protein
MSVRLLSLQQREVYMMLTEQYKIQCLVSTIHEQFCIFYFQTMTGTCLPEPYQTIAKRSLPRCCVAMVGF